MTKSLTKIVTYKSAKEKAWDSYSRYIRTRDLADKKNIRCFTCDKLYPAFGIGCAQAGHFIPGRHMSVIFNEKNCHAQCYNCNVRLKGNPVKYFRKMQEIYGDKEIELLEALDRQSRKYKVFELLELKEYYDMKTKALEDANLILYK